MIASLRQHQRPTSNDLVSANHSGGAACISRPETGAVIATWPVHRPFCVPSVLAGPCCRAPLSKYVVSLDRFRARRQPQCVAVAIRGTDAGVGPTGDSHSGHSQRGARALARNAAARLWLSRFCVAARHQLVSPAGLARAAPLHAQPRLPVVWPQSPCGRGGLTRSPRGGVRGESPVAQRRPTPTGRGETAVERWRRLPPVPARDSTTLSTPLCLATRIPLHHH